MTFDRDALVSARTPATESGRRGSLRDDTHRIVDDLQESAVDVEPLTARLCPNPEHALAQEGHHRGVSGKNANLAVVRRDDDGIRRALVYDRFWRDDRNVQHGSALLQLLGVLDDVLDAAGHEERLLGQVVELARHEALEARHRLLELD